MQKVLNLYAGIGGNRKLWPKDINVTAVELDSDIAKVYNDFYPDDTIVTGDAHEYLKKNYMNYDFIWASPPCPSHSRLNYFRKEKIFPDMKLWQEIIFLQSWAKCYWVIENVIPYYKPLIQPAVEICRHYFWSNFVIKPINFKKRNIETATITKKQRSLKIDLSEYKLKNKRQILRNCVQPEIGLHIFNSIPAVAKQQEIFN